MTQSHHDAGAPGAYPVWKGLDQEITCGRMAREGFAIQRSSGVHQRSEPRFFPDKLLPKCFATHSHQQNRLFHRIVAEGQQDRFH